MRSSAFGEREVMGKGLLKIPALTGGIRLFSDNSSEVITTRHRNETRIPSNQTLSFSILFEFNIKDLLFDF